MGGNLTPGAPKSRLNHASHGWAAGLGTNSICGLWALILCNHLGKKYFQFEEMKGAVLHFEFFKVARGGRKAGEPLVQAELKGDTTLSLQPPSPDQTPKKRAVCKRTLRQSVRRGAAMT